MENEEIIGIVGGLGPYAGLDLAQKIFDQTIAKQDQEHLSIALLSLPAEIADRTAFLLGKTKTNPADAIFKIITKLEQLGASVVGIPCNSMHSPPIFDAILEKLKTSESKIKLINMVAETAEFVRQNHLKIKNIGLLCTTGTAKTLVYQNFFQPPDFNIILPDETVQQDMVNNAIYDLDVGIKAKSNPVTKAAREKLLQAVGFLQKQGAEAIILGCTEIPLAISDKKIGQTIIIDPTLILARALIKQTNPNKLKPLSP
ncbi:MAG: aspartate/glutamate racemase family protein [Planctomycetota bacterium]|jgi:aspartate racemase